MMVTDPQSRYTLFQALLFLDFHSDQVVTAPIKDPSKKSSYLSSCVGRVTQEQFSFAKSMLNCEWFVWMALGMLLKSCIIMIYISFLFLIIALMLMNINLYFTWKMKKCSIFYTGNSNIRTIPVENIFINHTSIWDHKNVTSLTSD